MSGNVEMGHTDDCSHDTHLVTRMGIERGKKQRTDTVTSPLGQNVLRHLSEKEEKKKRGRRGVRRGRSASGTLRSL